MFAEPLDKACVLGFPRLYYSQFLFGGPVHRDAVLKVDEFLVRSLRGVPIIRFDEILRSHWIDATKKDFDGIADPFGSFRRWLLQTDDPRYYCELLPDIG